MEMEKRLLQESLGGCRVVSLWFFALLHNNPFSRWSWCPFCFLETMILLTFYDDQVSARPLVMVSELWLISELNFGPLLSVTKYSPEKQKTWIFHRVEFFCGFVFLGL